MAPQKELKLIGKAPEFESLLRSLQIAAATDATIMLLGESGTGKELLARQLHQDSSRRDAPFVTINCAALPEPLAESELFGHRKGAFTGAVDRNHGRIRAADGGTLFLDEIAELPLLIQAKLLRFLESGEYQAVGDTNHAHANIRIIAATHADLRSRVEEGLFREDLFYRLNVIPFEVPPLRERTGDIELLLKEITNTVSAQYQLRPPQYSVACLEQLNRYAWPGNIRELGNFCERMLILQSGQTVEVDNLPMEIRNSSRAAQGLFSLPDNGIKLDELEQDLMRQALSKANGNQSKAARLLGLTRDTFLYRLKKYAI